MKRVLVTGSTRGIGRKVAEKLLIAGYDVVLHGRDSSSENARQTIATLSKLIPSRHMLSFDIANRDQAIKVLEHDIVTKGAYYGVVLCAGVTHDAPFPALSGEDWDHIIGTNLGGFFNVLRPVVLPMIQLRAGGRIVVLSSLSGIIGNRGQVAYSAAKAGLIGASKALSRELAKRAITVNCVAPGPVETEMLSDEVAKQMSKVIPLGRPATVDEVAGAVTFLFQEDSAYITGQVLTLSGGLI